jgi:phosphoribosylglycinamide formyltransferase-1
LADPVKTGRAQVAVFVSGSGTNMAALLYASRLPDCPFEIVLVLSNALDTGGLALAKAEGIATFALPHKGIPRAEHDAAMEAEVLRAGAEYIALAGYMRILTPAFVARWGGRMVNIHPSLLPKYTGLHTHRRALEAGDSHGGCTVHLVTADLDEGPILGQIPVAIRTGDTADTLAARVLIAEHQLYARCLAEMVTRRTNPVFLLGKVRERAMVLPAAEETISHGMACFGIVKGKKFAYVSMGQHGDGKTALLVKVSGLDEQEQLIESDPARFYRPAYFGDSWIGVRLDLGDTDWDDIADRLQRSWMSIAPRKLAAMMEF